MSQPIKVDFFKLCVYIFGFCVGQVACAVLLVKIKFLIFCLRLPSIKKKLRLSYIFKKKWVVFHYQKIEVTSIGNKCKSSSICKVKLRSSFIFKKVEVVLHFQKN